MACRASQRGSSIVLALIGLAVVSVLVISYAKAYASIGKSQAKINLLNFISELQLNIRNTSNDPQSWIATIADSTHNSSMSCIQTQSCVGARPATEFVLWPADTTVYSPTTTAIYDGTNPSAGFTLSGQACTTFSMSGNTDCPLHVTLKWSTPGCLVAPCQPPIQIQADVLFRPSPSYTTIGAINEVNLTLTFTQQLAGMAVSCSGQPPVSEQTTCATPPYPPDQLICTSTGWRCGQLFF